MLYLTIIKIQIDKKDFIARSEQVEVFVPNDQYVDFGFNMEGIIEKFRNDIPSDLRERITVTGTYSILHSFIDHRAYLICNS